MNWEYYWELWTTGTFDETVTLALDTNKRYLVETYLTLTEGGDHAHAYILEICTLNGDQRLCGLNNEADAPSVFPLPAQADSVTLALSTTGGRHRSGILVYSY